ncbi:Glutamate receptor ionotropic, kainate 2 [Eumeta japonica]|uniref:Glutamate receptor ionotropic, kainate 2 n=1 Tax=Eumeta variegata TaxID=151549 RepID=A0A4C1ZME9_EUMVA|nr:Glutamate receptor ionotropic, kainate 2 [Eumeta japonica]
MLGHPPSRGLQVQFQLDVYSQPVRTRIEKPYVMVKDGWNLQGNARFEGFCIDLLARVASRAGFNYRLRLVPDNMYGVRDPNTGEWNGIVRELLDGKADLAVASMTINYAREAVIDFTKPFMNLGIGILFKVPTSQPTRLFSFLNPLAIEIWLYVLAAYVLVSFTLFVMARFSPYEWATSTHVCGHETKLVSNQFSVCNSFWFITGTFLRQGSGLNPRATSTRIVGGIWWFFTLIIISSYTANLAAFLTVERTVLPIQNAADLAAQTTIQYGTLNGGSTMTFFRDSNIDIYKTMWQHMSTASPPALVSSYEEGVKRVLQGNYAFLMESTMLDHRVQRDCNLTQIGGLLDSKRSGQVTTNLNIDLFRPACILINVDKRRSQGYGIATWKGSPWRDKMSLAILELQEKGVIQILYDKWWKNTGDVCNRDGKDSKANPLGVQNIGGVFVTLLCGLALAILVAILEFCWNTRRNSGESRQSLCSEMGQVIPTTISSTEQILECRERKPGRRLRLVTFLMDWNTGRLGISFCCTTGPCSMLIYPGLAVFLNGSTFKTSMQLKTFEALLQIEVGGNNCRIVRIKNKMILLFSWEQKTPFYQACSLLSTLGGADSGLTITSHIISVEAMAVSFETGEVVDRLRCIKAFTAHEVVVYKTAELEKSKQRAQKEQYKSQGRIRTLLEALRRAAKSMSGVKSLRETVTPKTKRNKPKVPIDSKTAPTRFQKKADRLTGFSSCKITTRLLRERVLGVHSTYLGNSKSLQSHVRRDVRDIPLQI